MNSILNGGAGESSLATRKAGSRPRNDSCALRATCLRNFGVEGNRMTVLANLLPSISVALDERSKYLRRLAVRTLDKGERGHIGSTRARSGKPRCAQASTGC